MKDLKQIEEIDENSREIDLKQLKKKKIKFNRNSIVKTAELQRQNSKSALGNAW